LEQFASGWKRNYYGKGDVIVYRLNRDGKAPAGQSAVFGANVKMLIYGDAFWPTYTAGDNTGLVATDSMKNFIQRETLNYAGAGLEEYSRFLAQKFLDLYPQAEGIQLSVVEIPYGSLEEGGTAFFPSGSERANSRMEINRSGLVEITSGIQGFKLLRLGGSSFTGFVRDQYTTLPDITNRPLHMWLDLDWRYTENRAAFSNGAMVAKVREIVHEVFGSFQSGSIQEVIYIMGTKILAEIPTIGDVHLEANNRTWDTVAERGDELGVFTDARPPYGCLGLRLRR
jgi:urate oxidase/2-oxo-4-hydroxy-4-carboxy-5-ureidoimidazoline decarboxylase